MHSCNAQNSYQLHKKVVVKKADTFLLLFQIQIKIRDSKARLENALVKRF